MSSGSALASGAADAQRALLPALMQPAAYPHPVDEIRLLETHISYVLLTGRFAYKIKKAVNPGFLDFTRLEQRHFFCEEELRLNSRLAPGLYLAVVPIGAAADGLQVGGSLPIVDYAVKMIEFPQSALLDRRIADGGLSAAQIDLLADRIADFHAQVARAGAGDDYGRPETVWQTVGETCRRLRAGLTAAAGKDTELALLDELDELEAWSRAEYARLRPVLAARKHDGFVRECHGDMHLGNIVWLDDAPLIFDGIEFNTRMRWIDVMNDLAFLVMDLEERGQAECARRLLNRYLEATGDYAGLQVLPFYKVYRALVRAMVACLRAAQEGGAAGRPEIAAGKQYLRYARQASLRQRAWLALMHGFSGSGKTTVAQRIVERSGAVRVRSDIERKRLSGLPALARGEAAVDRGIYDQQTTHATYLRLVQLARQVVDAGFPVVVDAASLKSWQREIFRSQARAQRVRFYLLRCDADEATLRQRLLDRAHDGGDASDAGLAVLRSQQQNSDPLSEAERAEARWVNGGNDALDGILSAIENDVWRPD
jgi:aminoglycoside phosphotransferase family enzyme/predicted kinase